MSEETYLLALVIIAISSWATAANVGLLITLG